MATVIKIKKSETSGSAPTTSDLVAGEVALNTADQVRCSGCMSVLQKEDSQESQTPLPPWSHAPNIIEGSHSSSPSTSRAFACSCVDVSASLRHAAMPR